MLLNPNLLGLWHTYGLLVSNCSSNKQFALYVNYQYANNDSIFGPFTPLKNKMFCLIRSFTITLSRSRPNLATVVLHGGISSHLFYTAFSNWNCWLFFLYTAVSEVIFWLLFEVAILVTLFINLVVSRLSCVKSANLTACHFP